MQFPTRTRRGGVKLLAFASLAMLLTSDFVSATAIGATTQQSSSKVEQPPHIFPEDNTKYKIIYNTSTLLKSAALSDDPSVSTQEIYELLHAPQLKSLEYQKLNPQQPSDTRQESEVHNAGGVVMNPKLESEMIQKVGAAVEKDDIKEFQGASKAEEQPGRWAALAAGTVLAVAVIAYIGLIFFRKRLERKYGSRHILVNEEENGRNF